MAEQTGYAAEKCDVNMEEIQVDALALSELAEACERYVLAMRQAAADLCREVNRFDENDCDGCDEFSASATDLTRKLDGLLLPAEELAKKTKARVELLRRRVKLESL